MKPLMMMRTKGLTGPRFARHAGPCTKLSKSAGNSEKYLSLQVRGAWTGTENCEAIGEELITLRLNRTVTFTTGIPGVTITHSNGGTFTVSSVNGGGTSVLEYIGTLDIPLAEGDIVTYDYDALIGDYVDDTGTPMASQTVTVTNCKDPG